AISLALYSHRRRVPRHSRPRALTPAALPRSRSYSRRSLLSPSPTPTGLLLVLVGGRFVRELVCCCEGLVGWKMDPGEQRRMTVVKAAAFVTVIYAWLMAMLRMGGGSSARITYGPLSAMDEERQKNLNKIYNCNDIECVNMLRMRRAPFFNLCNLLRSRNLLRDSINSCVEEQVAMFLHVVGHNQRFRVIHTNWRRSIETVSRYFREVLYAIGELRGEMIRPPGNETHSRIRTSPRWYPYFKGMADIFGNAGSDAPAAAEIVGSEAAPVEVVGDVPAAGDVGAGEARGRGAMRWTSAMSTFVLRRMCQLISTGVRTDKGFKEVHLNQVAKALQEFSGNDVTGTQVYNHLRKWRQRWMKVSKLRELSGANWDEDLCMISLEEEHYKGHIKAHPKDAEYLNKPIENYKQMEMIFGTGLATGKYAMGSNEPLGNPIADSGSAVKIESIDDKAARVIDDIAGLMSEAAKDAKEATSSATPAAPGTKRKRCALSEEDSVALSSMTDAVKDVAAAIRETKVEVLNPDLYGSVMYMAGFTEEALICAFSHLVDNKAQGDAFVKMIEAHRVLWLRTFLAKHYYI
ncbi:hypothetical protein EJB05_48052, partial [Eragrostis curvula]